MTPEQHSYSISTAVTLRDGRIAQIRPLSSHDGDALSAFFLAVPHRDTRFYYPHPLDRTNALRLAAQAESPHYLALVLALPDGRIAGLASCGWETDEAARSVFGLCIAADYQDVGAGRLLMTQLLQIASTAGPPVMSLTVQLANTRAVRLYRSMGFTVIREQMVAHDPSLGFDDELEYYMERQMRAPALS